MGTPNAAGIPAGVSFSHLVLNRLPGETIVVGEGLLVLKVEETRGDRVSVSVFAPRELRVDRGEVHARRMQEKRLGEAAGMPMARFVDAATRPDSESLCDCHEQEGYREDEDWHVDGCDGLPDE